jgi:predicted translin family RNA/ssDNA-binding protein
MDYTDIILLKINMYDYVLVCHDVWGELSGWIREIKKDGILMKEKKTCHFYEIMFRSCSNITVLKRKKLRGTVRHVDPRL